MSGGTALAPMEETLPVCTAPALFRWPQGNFIHLMPSPKIVRLTFFVQHKCLGTDAKQMNPTWDQDTYKRFRQLYAKLQLDYDPGFGPHLPTPEEVQLLVKQRMYVFAII